MSNLLHIAFPSEQKAEQVRREMNLIAMEDAVIAVKKSDGTIRLDQLAEPGAMWGIRAVTTAAMRPNVNMD